MSRDTVTLSTMAELQSHSNDWDSLPAQRATQADFYDTFAWFAAWWTAIESKEKPSFLVPAVLEGNRLLACLPLVASSTRRWESAGNSMRLRYRPVFGTEQPDDECLDFLAEEVARSGVRDLELWHLPIRDPATRSLVSALKRSGYIVSLREESSEYLAIVSGGWTEHRQRFRSYEKNVKRRVKHAKRFHELSLDVYGSGVASVLEGFSIYIDLHARSWKKSLREPTLTHRRELVTRAEQLGRVRIYILSISGVPAAADIWFRIGDVATCYSGAYDQQFAAASPGTILSWWGQESIFSESPPSIIDFLSGQNPQKDSLCPDQQPLVFLEAVRKSVVTGITFPLRRQMNRLRRGLAYRLHRPKTKEQEPSRCSFGRMVVFDGSREVLPAAILVLDEKLEFYLTLAVGQSKTKSMTESWVDGDEWWRVGEPAVALVRLGKVERENRPVREVIFLGEGTGDIAIILHSLAASLGTSISARIPDEKAENGEDVLSLHHTLLPFPGLDRACLDSDK